jgi:hypothetical protein
MAPKVSTTMVGDTMRVTVMGVETAQEARKLAGQASGTPFVGAAIAGGGGWTVDVSAKALAARKVVGKVPPARTMREEAAPVDTLAAVLASLDPAVAKVIRAALKAQAPAKADAPKAPKEPRPVPAFIVARAQAREAATCKRCLDFGVVRAAGPNAGQPYKTANGAAGASASKPCTCKAGKRAAKRTA